MTAHQLRQLEWMQKCLHECQQAGMPTPEQKAEFRLLVARQKFRDDAARHRDDLFECQATH